MTPCRWLLFSAVLCSSCATVYVPNARNVPLFSEAGQLSASAGLGTGINAQLAYAVTDHFAIMGSYLYANNKRTGETQYRSQELGEFGLGYYHRRRIAFEIYGGLGWGKGYGQDSSFAFLGSNDKFETARGRYYRAFIQPSIGIGRGVFRAAFTTRFSVVNFTSLKLQTNFHDEPTPNRSEAFFEPAVTVRLFPIRTIDACLFTQVGMSIPFNNYKGFDHEGAQFSMGVSVWLGKRSTPHLKN